MRWLGAWSEVGWCAQPKVEGHAWLWVQVQEQVWERVQEWVQERSMVVHSWSVKKTIEPAHRRTPELGAEG